MIYKTHDIEKIAEQLLDLKIGILPTDTVYGLHGLSNNKQILHKINKLKQRELAKPLITLISDIHQLEEYGINLDSYYKKVFSDYWPGNNTLILEDSSNCTHAFRLPDNIFLLDLINKTGPIYSTSANIHLNDVSNSISAAQEVFGNYVDFYVDGGELNNLPSNMYMVTKSKIRKIR